MKVVFTPLAEQHVEALYDYISDNSTTSRADQYISRIIAFCEGLTTFPRRGRARDDLLQGLRTIGFERRVTIAFIVRDDVIVIEGVFYGGRDFESAF